MLRFSQANDSQSRFPVYEAGAMFGYLAAFLQMVAFGWYGWTIYTGQTFTNPVAWYLWFAETAVGLIIYADRTRDVVKWIGEAVAMIGVILVALCLLVASIVRIEVTWATVEWIDLVPTAVAILAFALWLKTRDQWGPSAALWFFQIAIAATAVPLIRATYADPLLEPFGPWALWTVAFSCQVFCAWRRWDGIEPLLNPINYALTHGVIAWIIWQHAAS